MDTGGWSVIRGVVIEVETIVRGAYLVPVYGSSRVPEDFSHRDASDSFRSFFVNHFLVIMPTNRPSIDGAPTSRSPGYQKPGNKRKQAKTRNRQGTRRLI
ncbi:hypothetical protein BJV78DRAFT_1128840 [Lactifluus subvellereus]|nr:hypothetical protein BJV78DRAFT_1128840 [Lactifluus subvellereus]